MFDKILIANRGEIAVRIIRACRELGIGSVAVYSEADWNALHVLLADEAYLIGPASATESYLRIEALIKAARRSGAQAVHPGFGFLSENADFAEACGEAGLVFIGPPADAIRLMGDKIAAKRLVEQAGVPTVSGYHGGDQSPATLAGEASRVGYPILVKAAAGGGGRGMRIVEQPPDLEAAIEAARREARGAFGDDRIFLERYLIQPRHVEIQVLADAHGQVIHLGERECSIQRRHQKVVEESPSPALTPELRARMGQAAVAAARAARYVNAGTVEFILDRSGDFYFLEMNTRLQVEHPVTELVTGVDLVHLQIAIAAGRPLPLTQDDVGQRGQAIEARIYAEDPERGFLPTAGRLTAFAPPEGPGIRNDVGVYPGAEVPVHYDPMLAKLIVQGATRRQAIDRLRAALEEYEIAGVATNLPFLRWLAGHPAFAAGETTTDFIDRYFDPEQLRAPLPAEVLLGAAATDLLDREWAGPPDAARAAADAPPAGASDTVDIWRSAGPWRLLRTGVRLRYEAAGRPTEVVASQLGDQRWAFQVGDQRFTAEIARGANGSVVVHDGNRLLVFQPERRGDLLRLAWRGVTYRLTKPRPPAPESLAHGAQTGAAGTHSLTAPMPGTIVKILIEEGEQVEPNQSLVILEAMKMEHVIQAPYAGVVQRVHYRPGDLVAGGAALIDLAAE